MTESGSAEKPSDISDLSGNPGVHVFQAKRSLSDIDEAQLSSADRQRLQQIRTLLEELDCLSSS